MTNTDTYSDVPRALPADNALEQGLLAAIFADNAAYDAVADFLKPEHFSDALHGRIFAACAKLIERGERASVLSLRLMFEDDVPYLVKISADGGWRVNQAGSYGRDILDMYQRSEAIMGLENAADDLSTFDLDRTAETIIEATQVHLDDILGAGASAKGDLVPAQDAVDQALAQIEEARRRHATGRLVGLTTGLRDLDRILAGLHPGEMTIIAGRPSMGKSALAAGIAHVNACEGETVGFFSLEMTAAQIQKRLLSLRTGVPFARIRSGDLDDAEAGRLVAERDRLGALPLHIDDSRARTVPAIRSRARRLKRKHGLGLIVVDYLQLMTGAGRTRSNRQEEVADMTRELKVLAGEMEVPVLALSQLNRQVESRDDKRPQLGDLRESGAIEQDADVVLMIFREEQYLRDREPTQKEGEKFPAFEERRFAWEERLSRVSGKCDLIVSKQREGPTGSVHIECDMTVMRFADEGERP